MIIRAGKLAAIAVLSFLCMGLGLAVPLNPPSVDVPNYEDILFTSRWPRPFDASDLNDTYIEAGLVMPRRFVWNYERDGFDGQLWADYTDTLYAFPMTASFQVATSPLVDPSQADYNATKCESYTRTGGQLDAVVYHWLANIMGADFDLHKPASVERWLATARRAVDRQLGPDGRTVYLHQDNARLNAGSSANYGGCFGVEASAAFEAYLNDPALTTPSEQAQILAELALLPVPFIAPTTLVGLDYTAHLQNLLTIYPIGYANRPPDNPTSGFKIFTRWDGGLLQTVWERFQRYSVVRFYDDMRVQLTTYMLGQGIADPKIVMSGNTVAADNYQWLYRSLDYIQSENIWEGPMSYIWLTEQARQTGDMYAYVIRPEADVLAGEWVSTPAQMEDNVETFAQVYAIGSLPVYPWDVFMFDNSNPRYFADYSEWQIYNWVKNNTEYFAGYEHACVEANHNYADITEINDQGTRLEVFTHSAVLGSLGVIQNGSTVTIEGQQYTVVSSSFVGIIYLPLGSPVSVGDQIESVVYGDTRVTFDQYKRDEAYCSVNEVTDVTYDPTHDTTTVTYTGPATTAGDTVRIHSFYHDLETVVDYSSPANKLKFNGDVSLQIKEHDHVLQVGEEYFDYCQECSIDINSSSDPDDLTVSSRYNTDTECLIVHTVDFAEGADGPIIDIDMTEFWNAQYNHADVTYTGYAVAELTETTPLASGELLSLKSPDADWGVIEICPVEHNNGQTDITAPGVKIEIPQANDNIQPGATLSGTATDTGGSGISSVRIAIRDLNNSQWVDINGNSTGSWINLYAVLNNNTGDSADWSITTGNAFPQGSYLLYAVAVDTRQNAKPFTYLDAVQFSIGSLDTEPPEAFYTTPQANDNIQPGATLSGTATDTGGSGISSVRIAIRDLNNSQWVDSNGNSTGSWINLYAVLNNNTGDSADWSITTGNAFPQGSYLLYAVAVDTRQNAKPFTYLDAVQFSIGSLDTEPPGAFFTTPQANDNIQPGATLSGTATDTGGSGISSVRIAIRDLNNSQWVDSEGNSTGSWINLYAELDNNTGDSADWSITTGNAFPQGSYLLYAVAIDNQQNAKPFTYLDGVQFSIGSLDTDPPEAFFTTPQANDNIQPGATLRGTATDTGGSGISSVRIAIRDLNNSQWVDINGNSTGSWINLYAVLNNNTGDSADWSISTGNAFPNGAYLLYAVAVDSQQNAKPFTYLDAVEFFVEY